MPEEAEVIVVKSLRAFEQWLRNESSKSTEWFACRDHSRSKCLLLSASTSFEQQFDSVTFARIPLYPLQLPSPSNAREWWHTLWDGEIVVCRFSACSRMLVAAKVAVWNALPEFHLLRPKTDFVEVDLDDMRQIVGEKIESMLSECFFLGISTRLIDQATADRIDQLLILEKIPKPEISAARTL